MSAAVATLTPLLGTRAACRTLGVARAHYYRQRRPSAQADAHDSAPPVESPAPAGTIPPPGARRSPRALAECERQAVLDTLHSERFVDLAPAAVYATLLDEGTYLCSERTMYRVLAAADEVHERRSQTQHPQYARPELLATSPNQVWSWDISKLLGPAKWTYFYLDVILDVYSRAVVGWLVAHRETAELARRFIEATAAKHAIPPQQLTIHADRGSSMTSKPVAFLLADLGITKSHSRPHVSNDNPYSASQFKTLKYRHTFPARFASIEEARAYCVAFFSWYNDEHHHSGIGLLTPAQLHSGQGEVIYAARAATLAAAYAAHPDRFVHKPPQPPPLPEAAWINKPAAPTAPEEVRH